MDLNQLLALVWSYATQYPVLSVLVLAFIVKHFLSSKGGPFEEYPGNKVINIESLAEWNEQITIAKTNRKLVVIDFYALWCPPCRRAAPIFGKMSLDYENVIFMKVDVDKASAVARDNSIRAMPTFKIFKDAQQ
eukprot:gene8458-11437_t